MSFARVGAVGVASLASRNTEAVGATGCGVAVLGGCAVSVGAIVAVFVGCGVFVGTSVAVGAGVDDGKGVGASRVSTARAVARAALTTAVASSQPGAAHCASAKRGVSANNNTNTATIVFMIRIRQVSAFH